jgi:hypothetical protein
MRRAPLDNVTNPKQPLTLSVVPNENQLSDRLLVKMKHRDVVTDLDLARLVDDHDFDGYKSCEYGKPMMRQHAQRA